MALKNRSPLQVSPEFKKKLEELQKKIMMAQGEKPSFRKITEEIINSPMFDEIEKNLVKSGDIKMDIKVRFDRRAFE